MSKCESCGVELIDHLGLMGTCAELQKYKTKKTKKWHKIDPDKTWIENGAPMGEAFLIYTNNKDSDLKLYEVIGTSRGAFYPETGETFKTEDFSHWRRMIKLPKGER